jgi:hypothetical protein
MRLQLLLWSRAADPTDLADLTDLLTEQNIWDALEVELELEEVLCLPLLLLFLLLLFGLLVRLVD